jgi:hypothetical protein
MTDPDQLLGASSSRGFARRVSGGDGDKPVSTVMMVVRYYALWLVAARPPNAGLVPLMQEIRCHGTVVPLVSMAGAVEFQFPPAAVQTRRLTYSDRAPLSAPSQGENELLSLRHPCAQIQKMPNNILNNGMTI